MALVRRLKRAKEIEFTTIVVPWDPDLANSPDIENDTFEDALRDELMSSNDGFVRKKGRFVECDGGEEKVEIGLGEADYNSGGVELSSWTRTTLSVPTLLGTRNHDVFVRFVVRILPPSRQGGSEQTPHGPDENAG